MAGAAGGGRGAANPVAEPMSLRRELALRGVSFSYPMAVRGTAPGRPPGVGRRRSRHPGSPVGRRHRAVGRAGKTTLADLLVGLLAPDAGAIHVDGAPLGGDGRRHKRRSVACVPQDPHLFHETVRANLLRARPDATEAELWDALAPGGGGLRRRPRYRGRRLRRAAVRGERQRVVLARALPRRPALLVLDEATGATRRAAEPRLAPALRSLRDRMTIVVVTHRPARLAAANTIVVLEAGRVAAAGRQREIALRLAVDATEERSTSGVELDLIVICPIVLCAARATARAPAAVWRSTRTAGRAGPPWRSRAAGSGIRATRAGGTAYRSR